MGVQQFSNPQLAVIQAATDAIQVATTAILGKVNPVPEPFSQMINLTPTTLNTWQTILSKTGSGILDAVSIGTQVATLMANIRITIDGVVLHWTHATSVSSGGLHQMGDTVGIGTILAVRNPATVNPLNVVPTYSHPHVAGGNGTVLLSHPLVYKTSLLIEVKSMTVNGAIYTDIRGGEFL